MANAYDFRIVGEEELEGVNTWVIEATPRKDFKPTQPHADMLKKIKGKMWIDKKEYNWIRVEAEATDTISFGVFLFRIHPGSRFNFQQMHLNDEVWLLRRLYINGGARIALLKNEAIEQEDTFSNYKKFSSTFTILPGVKEVPSGRKAKVAALWAQTAPKQPDCTHPQGVDIGDSPSNIICSLVRYRTYSQLPRRI